MRERTAGDTAIARAVFLVAIVAGSAGLAFAWNASLENFQAFRQTQTAINVYYLVRGSDWLAYRTPVFGPPWSVPFEFPLYQWIVALVSRFARVPLDPAGRLVGIAFYFGSMRALWLALGEAGILVRSRYVVLALYACNPFYVFWSRAFLIESTALCLALAFVAAAGAYARAPTPARALVALVAGTLGAVVKITTFAVGWLAAAALVVAILRARPAGARPPLARLAPPALAFFALPLAATAWWTRVADGLKSTNSIAAHVTSHELTTWNFGTLAQRLRAQAWSAFLERVLTDFWGDAFVALGALVLAFAFARRRAVVAACLGLFLAGPLLFTNLYFVHDYYAYGSGVFLIAAAGLAADDLAFGPAPRRVLGIAALVTLFAFQGIAFAHVWYRLYLGDRVTNEVLVTAHAIRDRSRADDVVEIYGLDWSPELAYYSERQTLMHPDWWPERGGAYDALRRALGPDEPALIVFCDARLRPPADRRAQLAVRGFATRPAYANDFCRVYARDPAKRARSSGRRAAYARRSSAADPVTRDTTSETAASSPFAVAR